MIKTKITLQSFLTDPKRLSEILLNEKVPSLEEVQPIIIQSSAEDDGKIIIEELEKRGIKYFVNPPSLINGFSLNLNQIEIIY